MAFSLQRLVGAPKPPAPSGPDLNALMLRDFLNVCANRGPGHGADWEAGDKALRVVLAAYASERTGQAVALSGLPHLGR